MLPVDNTSGAEHHRDSQCGDSSEAYSYEDAFTSMFYHEGDTDDDDDHLSHGTDRAPKTGQDHAACDDDEEERDDGTGTPPAYLMKAILAGLYELPPKHILKYQTGWGRRVRYERVVRIDNQFKVCKRLRLVPAIPNCGCDHGEPQMQDDPRHAMMAVISKQRLTRRQFTANKDLRGSSADFFVYRVEFVSQEETDDNASANSPGTDTVSRWNQQLMEIALEQERDDPDSGMDVSNAGGSWHGPPNLLDGISAGDEVAEKLRAGGDGTAHSRIASSEEEGYAHAAQKHGHFKCLQQLHHAICQTISTIDDMSASSSAATVHAPNGESTMNTATLEFDPSSIECWVNISRHGSWNRLHTHETSAWSGVYYVSDGRSARPSATRGDPYGGRLVLKPTPHAKEDTYALEERELQRLIQIRAQTSLEAARCCVNVDSTCEYLDIPPKAGTMIIFPSWLHHCVLPLEVDAAKATTAQSTDCTKCTQGSNEHEEEEHDEHGDEAPFPRISIAFNVNWKKQPRC